MKIIIKNIIFKKIKIFIIKNILKKLIIIFIFINILLLINILIIKFMKLIYQKKYILNSFKIKLIYKIKKFKFDFYKNF